MPARGVEQQSALLIYIEEPAVQGGGVETDQDRLAEGDGARPPRRPDRREALLAPVLRPGSEMVGERFEHGRRFDPGRAFRGGRSRRKLRIGRRRGEVDADADDDKGQGAPGSGLQIRAGSRRSCGRRSARRSAICRRGDEAPGRARRGRRRPQGPRQSRVVRPDPPDKSAAGQARDRDCPVATPRPGHAARARRSARAPTPGSPLPPRRGQGAWPRRWCCRPCRRRLADSPRRAAAATGSRQEQRRSRRLGAADDRSREQEKEHRHDRGHEQHALELGCDRAIEGARSPRRNT